MANSASYGTPGSVEPANADWDPHKLTEDSGVADPPYFSVSLWRNRPRMGRRGPSSALMRTGIPINWQRIAGRPTPLFLCQSMANSASNGSPGSVEPANVGWDPDKLTEDSGMADPPYFSASLWRNRPRMGRRGPTRVPLSTRIPIN